MALLYSPKVENEFFCPSFSCPGVDGNIYNNKSFSDSKALIFAFICNHCPYVQAVQERWVKLASTYSKNEVSFLSICSNSPDDHPEDSFENIKTTWSSKNFDMPYLFDQTQKMAKDFGAVCTPDFFVFKKEKIDFNLYYRGRLDDSWRNPNNVKVTELKNAIDLLLTNKPAPTKQVPSLGCSIKWN